MSFFYGLKFTMLKIEWNVYICCLTICTHAISSKKKKNQICFIKMNLITDINYLFFFKLVIKIVRKINVHQSIKFWYTYWIKRTKDNSYIMWCKCCSCIMKLINNFCRICKVYAESVCVFVFILPSIWLINLWSRV